VTRALALSALALLASGAAQSATPPVPAFDHVVVVVFENKEVGSVLGSRSAPTFNLYARTYARLTQSYAVAHPSLPNYLALVSGSTFGIRSSCTVCLVAAPSVADTIEASGRTWKAYAEDLPAPGYLGAFSGGYAKKHNPFAYFQRIVRDPERARRIVPLGQLSTDLAAGTFPDFAFVVPNLCNSMHDCSVGVGDRWLRQRIGPLLRLPRTVVFVTFDEGRSSVRGGGHIATLAVGTAVKQRVAFKRVTTHYGLLRTIEDAWGLPRLGASARATPVTGIWR
jgi:phosphatidylinositol-3-phosphatase